MASKDAADRLAAVAVGVGTALTLLVVVVAVLWLVYAGAIALTKLSEIL